MIETTEVLLGRHGESTVNVQDLAFGNVGARLTEKGIAQSWNLEFEFREEHGIYTPRYDRTVGCSEFMRTRQTAHCAGFKQIEILPLINEVELTGSILEKGRIIEKHREERWVPEELQERARRFIDMFRAGQVEHEIYFTHGFFIAAVLDQLSREYEARGEVSPYPFDDRPVGGRGYIPLQGSLTPVKFVLAA